MAIIGFTRSPLRRILVRSVQTSVRLVQSPVCSVQTSVRSTQTLVRSVDSPMRSVHTLFGASSKAQTLFGAFYSCAKLRGHVLSLICESKSNL